MDDVTKVRAPEPQQCLLCKDAEWDHRVCGLAALVWVLATQL